MDWTIGRLAANVATLGAGDSLRIPVNLFMGAAGQVALGSTIANRLDLASGDTLRLVGGPLQFIDATAQIDAPVAGNLEVTATRVGFNITPTGANWFMAFTAVAQTITVGGDFANMLNSAGGNHTIDAALSTFTQWTVNAPAGTLGTGSVVDAANIIVQTSVALGTNRYGVLITSNPSGGTLNHPLRVVNGITRVNDLQLDGQLIGVRRSIFIRGNTFGNGANAPALTSRGTTPEVAVLRFSATNQSVVASVQFPGIVDTTQDVTITLMLALDVAEVNADAMDWTLDYIIGVAQSTGAGLTKTSSQQIETLTVTTANGLAINDLYELTFTLAAADANNPVTGDVLSIELTPTDLSSGIAAILIVDAEVEYGALI